MFKDKVLVSGGGKTFSGYITEAYYTDVDKWTIKIEIINEIDYKYEETVKELHDRASKLEEESLSYLSTKSIRMAHTKMDQARCLRVAANNLENISAT